jgi:CheY-like chemotaxis protein
MKRILIVDDEPHVIRVLRLSLEQSGYIVDDAANGIKAMEYLGKQKPDLVITDIDMPGMNGKELCMEIVRVFPDRDFRIYVLTARAELEHRQWATEILNLTLMEKPVSIRKLLSELDTFFADEDMLRESTCQSAP